MHLFLKKILVAGITVTVLCLSTPITVERMISHEDYKIKHWEISPYVSMEEYASGKLLRIVHFKEAISISVVRFFNNVGFIIPKSHNILTSLQEKTFSKEILLQPISSSGGIIRQIIALCFAFLVMSIILHKSLWIDKMLFGIFAILSRSREWIYSRLFLTIKHSLAFSSVCFFLIFPKA